MNTDMCVNCKERPADLDWVGEGGAIGYVHGMYVRWCNLCAWKAQLDYARRCAASIPELEQKIASAGTRGPHE